jgi:hypothetical protein
MRRVPKSGAVGAEEDHTVVQIDAGGHVDHAPKESLADQFEDASSGQFDGGQALLDLHDGFDREGSIPEFPNSSFLEDQSAENDTGLVMGASCISGTYRLVGDRSNEIISDHSITASTYWHNRGDHGRGQMWRSRFNNYGTSWCAWHNRNHEWIEWNFGSEKLVTKVMTKGRHNANQYVTRYRLMYYYKGWKWLNTHFTGNHNHYAMKTNLINPPVRATKIRLYVEGWYSHISLRGEFEGCNYVDPTKYKGSAGAKGPPGAKGVAGVAGAKGGSGAKGTPGAQGPPGKAGAKGPPGAKGDAARAAAKGSPGKAGGKGPRGAKGPPGPPGKTGITGVKGDKGASAKPIDCAWAEWADYSDCTMTCGHQGTKVRSRGFQVEPQNGGHNCLGSMFQTAQCNAVPCPSQTDAVSTKSTRWSKKAAVHEEENGTTAQTSPGGAFRPESPMCAFLVLAASVYLV